MDCPNLSFFIPPHPPRRLVTLLPPARRMDPTFRAALDLLLSFVVLLFFVGLRGIVRDARLATRMRGFFQNRKRLVARARVRE